MVQYGHHHRRKRQREYNDTAQLAGHRRVRGNGCGPGDVCEWRVFVCFLGYGGELGVVDSEYRRGGGADYESGVAGGGSFGQRAIRTGVCESRFPLPVS